MAIQHIMDAAETRGYIDRPVPTNEAQLECLLDSEGRPVNEIGRTALELEQVGLRNALHLAEREATPLEIADAVGVLLHKELFDPYHEPELGSYSVAGFGYATDTILEIAKELGNVPVLADLRRVCRAGELEQQFAPQTYRSFAINMLVNLPLEEGSQSLAEEYASLARRPPKQFGGPSIPVQVPVEGGYEQGMISLSDLQEFLSRAGMIEAHQSPAEWLHLVEEWAWVDIIAGEEIERRREQGDFLGQAEFLALRTMLRRERGTPDQWERIDRDYEEAIAAAQMAQGQDPTAARTIEGNIWRGRGMFYFRQGGEENIEKAKGYLAKATELHEETGDHHGLLMDRHDAALYKASDDPETAYAELIECAKEFKSSGNYLHGCVTDMDAGKVALRIKGRFGQARALFESSYKFFSEIWVVNPRWLAEADMWRKVLRTFDFRWRKTYGPLHADERAPSLDEFEKIGTTLRRVGSHLDYTRARDMTGAINGYGVKNSILYNDTFDNLKAQERDQAYVVDAREKLLNGTGELWAPYFPPGTTADDIVQMVSQHAWREISGY